MNANTCAGIVKRLIGMESHELSPEAARSLLQLDFPESDHARVAELSAKAQTGELEVDERDELDEYIRVADMLAVIQSRARRSLQRLERAS